MLKLGCTESTILRSAVIRGDAITAETNFCEYVSDADAIARDGTVAENITTPYFSETLRDGVPYYRIWIARRLVRLLRRRKGFFCKTNRALFHARVGAAVRVELADGLKSERAEIVRMELRYKKNEAFVTSFYLEEGCRITSYNVCYTKLLRCYSLRHSLGKDYLIRHRTQLQQETKTTCELC